MHRCQKKGIWKETLHTLAMGWLRCLSCLCSCLVRLKWVFFVFICYFIAMHIKTFWYKMANLTRGGWCGSCLIYFTWSPFAWRSALRIVLMRWLFLTLNIQCGKFWRKKCSGFSNPYWIKEQLPLLIIKVF